ncbi:carboxymuconolactone decarboxylase family protein [Actinoplanes sp. CA-142083]|uniref:carboxymuconolactone decarboxylase family protein n=1 Tax=Actinoplanes sp. CA-142083 TaxID=3239903 RepID=UPI003D8ADEBE
MEARINPFGTEFGPKFVKYIVSAARVVAGAGVPAATLELVNIRASQINGCAGCLDMHTKDALQAGETPLRINLAAAWREATVFTDAEKAALELAELGSRLADGGGVPDDVWASAAKHYDDEQLMALVCQIAMINAFNRMNVMTRQPGGSYEPGHLPV